MGQRGAELRNRETEPDVHDGNHARGDEQPPEPTREQPEVPAEEVAGDDRADAERPERPRAGEATQAAALEVGRIGLLVVDSRFVARHGSLRLARRLGTLRGGRNPNSSNGCEPRPRSGPKLRESSWCRAKE